MTLDCSILSDSVSKSAKMEQVATKEHIVDWSLLPEELLQLISKNLEKKNSFFAVDAIHARSVCNSWRSTFPFPSYITRQSYSLPPFSPGGAKDLCTLQKIPLFLFRSQTQTSLPCEYFLGGIAKDYYHTQPPSSIQCSVKANQPESDSTVMNMLDCQILPLGHHYRMMRWNRKNTRFLPYIGACYEGSAFLQEEEGEGFVLLLNYCNILVALRSSEMRWIEVERITNTLCENLYTFRGKFYAVFLDGEVFMIDPYSLEGTHLSLMHEEDVYSSTNYLVPCGNEELFLIEKIKSISDDVDLDELVCRVSRLDEEAGEWVLVSDLGDYVLFIGHWGNTACFGKDLPNGCGLSGNSILFTNEPGGVTFTYKYGVETGNAEDDLSFCWRLSRENRVLIRNTSHLVLALRVDHDFEIRTIGEKENSSLLLDSVSRLQLSPSSSETKEQTLHKPNWSLLPKELLKRISTHLEKKYCFFAVDAIHARSVCNSWRSTFAFPSRQLSRQSYSIPSISEPSILSTIEKFPLFLFRVRTQTPLKSPPQTSEYFLGGISPNDHMEPLSPLYYPIYRKDHHTKKLSYRFQCSVKADFEGYKPFLMDMVDCQILPLGYHYRMISCDNIFLTISYKGMAFLWINKEEEEFVVLLNYSRFLLVLRSSEMKWLVFERTPIVLCNDIVTFRGKFYLIFENGETFVIGNEMELTPLVTLQDLNSSKYLVASSDEEELFLVEKFFTRCRVSKLDEEAGEWIRVNDLGDRVLIIKELGNVAFSGKLLPDGCGLSGNSILITDDDDSNITFLYKYGVETGITEEDDNIGSWRLSREDRVLIRNKSPPVLALRVDRVLDT